MLRKLFDKKYLKIDREHMEYILNHQLYTHDQYLTLDISPDDERQHWNKKYTHARLNNIRQYYQQYIDQIREYSKEYAEVIEISKTGRIHYHIVLKSDQITELVGYIGYVRIHTHTNIKLDAIHENHKEKPNISLAQRVMYMKKDGKNILSTFVK